MAELFHGRWTANYGAAPDLNGGFGWRWLRALSKFSPAQIEHGLERAAQSGGKYLPSLPELVKWCQEASDPCERAYAMPFDRRLPEPPDVAERRKQLGRDQIAAMRASGLLPPRRGHQ